MGDIKLFIKKEFILLLLLLFLFIDLNGKGFYTCFIIAFYFVTIKFTSFFNSLDKLGILLILFSISYSILYSNTSQASTPYILVYAISPITFYALGKYFWNKYRSDNIFLFLLLFLSLGYSLIPAISIVYRILESGFTGGRNVTLLTRNTETGATLLGGFFTMNMAAIGPILVQSSRRIENKIKFISLGAFLISVLCVLRVASRTQLLIAVISVVVTISYLILKRAFSRKSRLLLTFAIAVVVIFLTVYPNSPFLNIMNERNNSEEQITEANGRTILWEASLNNLTSKPFGWEMPKSASYISTYCHNLWLDVDRVAGIIPFTFLSLFTILCIFLVKKILKIRSLDLYLKITILVWFIGFMAVFFVEPIIEGFYILFLIFCIFIGMISNLNNRAPI